MKSLIIMTLAVFTLGVVNGQEKEVKSTKSIEKVEIQSIDSDKAAEKEYNAKESVERQSSVNENATTDTAPDSEKKASCAGKSSATAKSCCSSKGHTKAGCCSSSSKSKKASCGSHSSKATQTPDVQ